MKFSNNHGIVVVQIKLGKELQVSPLLVPHCSAPGFLSELSLHTWTKRKLGLPMLPWTGTCLCVSLVICLYSISSSASELCDFALAFLKFLIPTSQLRHGSGSPCPDLQLGK